MNPLQKTPYEIQLEYENARLKSELERYRPGSLFGYETTRNIEQEPAETTEPRLCPSITPPLSVVGGWRTATSERDAYHIYVKERFPKHDKYGQAQEFGYYISGLTLLQAGKVGRSHVMQQLLVKANHALADWLAK